MVTRLGTGQETLSAEALSAVVRRLPRLRSCRRAALAQQAIASIAVPHATFSGSVMARSIGSRPFSAIVRIASRPTHVASISAEISDATA